MDGKRLAVALFEPDTEGPRRGRRGRAGAGRGASGVAGSELLTAPMQGTIVKTAVDEGDRVVAGDLVLVLEAMKMENHISAHRDGVVTTLHVAAGDVVNSGDPLATIEERGAEGGGDPRDAPDQP